MTQQLIHYLLFPGLLFMVIAGGFLSWFDRKITAWVQFRKGPPLLQPLYDFVKLMVKETILPRNASRVTFLLSPIFAATGAIIAGLMILLPAFGVSAGFDGDIIVIFYVLAIPSLSYIIGALSSGNLLASVGASREMKLIIGYELCFLLILAAIILKSGYQLDLAGIVAVQQADGAFIGSVSGVLLFVALMMCIQAKLGMVPFDAAEAETEIASGFLIEYSGPPLAFIKLSKYILILVLPVLVVSLMLGGLNLNGWGIIWAVLKILLVVLLVTLVRNTNPRLTIKQSMRFFFIWMNLLVIAAIVLEYMGL
ncbi:MAG: complex I subunit 1 family protein [Bacteroidales bacterium]|nr:NADH-quinone oxidoreductase subunit H [Bacteroidales bacterium]MDZ4203792.1 complex I subunit 1 family protein [Bacteroidales bacterium]